MSIPQTELSVASGIGVPVGNGGHPPLQPRALDDEVGERGLRHVERVGGDVMAGQATLERRRRWIHARSRCRQLESCMARSKPG